MVAFETSYQSFCFMKKDGMNQFIRNNKWPLLLTLTGGAGGFLYWKFVGCTSGTCPIQSVWYWSTLWGAVVGYLVGDFIRDVLQKRKKRDEVEP